MQNTGVVIVLVCKFLRLVTQGKLEANSQTLMEDHKRKNIVALGEVSGENPELLHLVSSHLPVYCYFLFCFVRGVWAPSEWDRDGEVREVEKD